MGNLRYADDTSITVENENELQRVNQEGKDCGMTMNIKQVKDNNRKQK